MDETLRQQVRDRAGNRCEYCRLHQEHYPLFRHQIEHIVPIKHHGGDEPDNLALACIRCNSGKSSNLAGLDQATGEIVPLFHPRNENWHDHFQFDRERIVGKSPTGVVTAVVLNMNEPQRLQLRLQLLLNGELD